MIIQPKYKAVIIAAVLLSLVIYSCKKKEVQSPNFSNPKYLGMLHKDVYMPPNNNTEDSVYGEIDLNTFKENSIAQKGDSIQVVTNLSLGSEINGAKFYYDLGNKDTTFYYGNRYSGGVSSITRCYSPDRLFLDIGYGGLGLHYYYYFSGNKK